MERGRLSVQILLSVNAVLLYLLIVAALNLAVGYGLALVLLRARAESRQLTPAPALTMPLPPVAPPAELPSPEPFSMQILPPDWLLMLQDAGAVNSVVEAAIHVLRTEAARYRERLVEVDGLLRRCMREPQTELLIMCLGELQQANADWLEKQSRAVEVLQEKRVRVGGLVAMSMGLEEILMEQTAQVEATCSNIKLFDLRSDPQAGAARLVGEVCKLVELCHRLRDRMQESLLSVLVKEGRLMALDPQRLIDPATNVHNRLGLERMLAQWWADDPSRSRQASFALVDIDRLRRINEQWGPLIGDRLVADVGRRIAHMLRSNRGFDVAGRLGRQTFAIFLGDTKPESATAAAERIRQTIQAQRFVVAEQEVEVRVTCGVVEVGREDTLATLHQRGAQTLREAKRAGRNLTLLHTRAGATVVEPPVCEVKAGVVRLDEESSTTE